VTTAASRRFNSPHHAAPRTHLLSNDNYCVMITAAGSGYSRWRDIAVTRWREDPICDPWGFFLLLRDVEAGQVWSAGYQPVGCEPDTYDAAFFEDRAQIIRTDGSMLTATEILVAPEDDAEARCVCLTNRGRGAREIEVTSYAEVVLASADSDSAHPAFSKMFVQTEFVAEGGALLATRRAREPDDPPLWMFHHCVVEGDPTGALQFETDRARFLGRGRDLRNAAGMVDARPLSNTTGTVLDPVLALRRRVRIAAGQSARIVFWSGIAPSRSEALALRGRYRDMSAFDRIKAPAAARASAELRRLGVDAVEAQQFQRIANRVLYAEASLRASREILGRNDLGPSLLWPLGISGDLPIVLAQFDDRAHLEIIAPLLRAHRYWQAKRLAVDLVVLNDCPAPIAAELQQELAAAIATAPAHGPAGGDPRCGRIFLLSGEALPPSHRELLQTASRAIFNARAGSVSDQLARLCDADTVAPPPPRRPRSENPAARAHAPQDTHAPQGVANLEFFNGFGGFAAAGREYVTVLPAGQWTPAPWINVIANPQFGTLVSADGAGSTWSINAQQNQLTPWSNDPVSNAPSEAIYIRDEDSGELWSATPLPIREPAASYIVRHGFGYSRFEHAAHGIDSELLQFVPLEEPLKVSRLKIVNRSRKARRLSITYYLEWVLGNQRGRSAPFIVTELDPETSALMAKNPWSADFQGRIAFMDMGGRQQSCSGDRGEFIGRHGSLAEPAALLGPAPLSNRVGGGLDPCGAMQCRFSLRPGEETDFVVILGEEASKADALTLVRRARGLDLDAALRDVADFWERTLGAIQVRTPDRSMDVMLNGWLIYQTLACRLWGRTAFYQSSGAYGYRDQLQDVMALCVAQPSLAREHILRAAARQFMAGDVQHWWLPASGQGIKNRVSDARVWLPFVVAHYLEVTADSGLLNEPVSFLEGGPLEPGQRELFSAPAATADTAPLYEHCVRALDSSLAVGSHGLPLFGAGDWNDGMNRVGAAGRGESVWLGWFLIATLRQFAPLADSRGDAAKSAAWREHATALQQAIEREAWDGAWYRRGYFDDGTALGSVSNPECRIDSISQSWGVISGAAQAERAQRAMSAVDAELVSRTDGLVRLLTPPFDRSDPDPGYIRAYPPGLRENGGQYTHAALWTALAFAHLGDGDRAGELWSMINPINHASTRETAHRYKVEPYVVCADVYSAPAHVGRGGWTWYTGSASWMYRTAIEGILGIHLRGAVLRISPCIPRIWPGFEVHYRYGSSGYRIAVENPQGMSRGIARATLDGQTLPGGPCDIELKDDGLQHQVRITLG
jgi:cyclic beta-1,2-glucan synthetase